MDDVIKQSGQTFGASECFKLITLSLAAIPTSFVIFLELVTTEQPEVCVYDKTMTTCKFYNGQPENVCRLGNQTLWEYDYPLRTIIGTYNLLCQAMWERCLPQLLFYLGMLPSCVFAGYLSDKFGRKTSLMLFLAMECVFLSLLIAARDYISFLILRYFTGLCIGYLVNCETLIIEGLKAKYRNVFLAAIWCSFSVGTLLLGVLSMTFSRYIDMVACVVIYNCILLVLYVLGIDESLRWLLIKQKKDRAQYQLNKIAYRNKVTLPKYEEIPKPLDDQFSIHDFYRVKKSRSRRLSGSNRPIGLITLILLQLSILSFYLLVEFMRISTNSMMHELNFKKYGFKDAEHACAVNFILSGFVNVVGVVLTSMMCQIVGRRPTVVVELCACFVALVLMISMPSQFRVLDISSYIIRLAAPGLVYLSSLYSLEVNITPLRARAAGLSIAGAALGGILSSIKVFFGDKDKPNSIITGIEIGFVVYMLVLSMKLPETKGRSLPDKLDDMPGLMGITDWFRCERKAEAVPLLEGKHGKHSSEETSCSTVD